MRFWFCLWNAALLAATMSVSAEELLTEGRAVDLGLTYIDVRDWLQGQRDSIVAKSRKAGHWHNPEIEYSREDLDLSLGSSRETTYWLKQRFNISGQLGLERDAAQQQGRAEEINIDLMKQSLAGDIRFTFYNALHAKQQAAILQDSANRLAKLSSSVKQRAHAGDVSRYDSLRLQREWVLLQGQATTTQAQADAAAAQLINMIGIKSAPPSLAGQLLPLADLPLAQWENKLTQHPRLKYLTMQADAKRLSAKAAAREAWPELTLGVGQRELSESGFAADGNSIAIGIEIPLFKRGNHKRDHANAQMRTLQVEQRLLHQQLLTELRANVKLLQARRQAVENFNKVLNVDADSLTRIAEQAYWSGEMQVMALLDTYRSSRETQLQNLELQLNARTSYIDIQNLIGE